MRLHTCVCRNVCYFVLFAAVSCCVTSLTNLTSLSDLCVCTVSCACGMCFAECYVESVKGSVRSPGSDWHLNREVAVRSGERGGKRDFACLTRYTHAAGYWLFGC